MDSVLISTTDFWKNSYFPSGAPMGLSHQYVFYTLSRNHKEKTMHTGTLTTFELKYAKENAKSKQLTECI